MNCASCGAVNSPQSRYCAMCGEQLRSAGGRERRRVSVVFIDLTAFTTLTLGFDPEELRDLADEVLTVVAGVIEDYDGYVDSFRGDGLIALFGAPRSHPDDPERAVLAAAAGLRAIETIGRAKGYPLKGRAGVNTGIVIAGAVGSGRVRDYTVMGSTVNLAARLEAVAIPGEVWVGPETFESTRHRLVYETSRQLRLAGFPNVRQAHRLVSTVEQYDHDPYAHLRFVGRAAELGAIEERFRRAAESGRVHELWLLGEAGSGKTRLLREFIRSLDPSEAPSLWLTGAAGESTIWLQLARQLLGLQEGEEVRVRQQRVMQALQSLLPGDSRRHRQLIASLGLAEAGAAPERRNGASIDAYSSVAQTWRDVLLAAGRQSRSATLLAVDGNPHDAQLRELLPLLAGGEAPLLLVRTSRERLAPPGADALALGPLGAEAGVALLAQLINPKLRVATESLLQQVSGVPAYIIELGRALSSARSGSISGSLASLLQARLDLLTTTERQMLTLAALTGERSWERLLLDLSDGASEGELQRLLKENLLVLETSSDLPGQVAYRFQSELLRHAVLRMIPFGDRPTLHLKIATWLEQNAPLALSETIAFHFREGGSPEAAYPHYLAAADLAASQVDPSAQTLFETLLELDLPAELTAQGTLAYAQAALTGGALETAARQLDAADRWIEAASPESREELREAQRRLRSDLAELTREEQAI
jgi:class 3 adenylate cyclase